jgi:hypothetical protein
MILKPPKGAMLNRGHNLSRGLVGCWLMNEAPKKTGTIYDLSGQGHNGTLVADAEATAGKFGPALVFDGTGDYVDIPNVSLSYPFSMLAGFNMGATAGECIVSAGSLTAGYYHALLLETKLKARTWDGTLCDAVSPDNAIANQEYQMAGVWTRSTLRTLYIDGKWISENTTDGSVTVDRIRIGVTCDSTPLFYCQGRIDYVMVWKRALTASESLSLYREPFQMFWVDM